MRRQKYPVRLDQDERERLKQLVRGGKSRALVMTRARILLKIAEGWNAPKLVEALDVSVGTVFRIKRRFAEDGLEGALLERPRPRPWGSWTTRERPILSPWPVAQRRRAKTTGPCGCWPGKW